MGKHAGDRESGLGQHHRAGGLRSVRLLRVRRRARHRDGRWRQPSVEYPSCCEGHLGVRRVPGLQQFTQKLHPTVTLLPPLSPLFCVRAQDGERSTARGLSTDVDWLSVPGHFEYIFSIHSAVEWVRRRFFDKFPEVCNSYFKSFPLAMAVD